jgi:hypothetical protein
MVTVHVPPEERAHVFPDGNEMLPVPPLCVRVAVSPVTGLVKLPSVTVHTELEPTLKLDGVQETEIVSE